MKYNKNTKDEITILYWNNYSFVNANYLCSSALASNTIVCTTLIVYYEAYCFANSQIPTSLN